jgi:RND family efflux transporter MFP subunit
MNRPFWIAIALLLVGSLGCGRGPGQPRRAAEERLPRVEVVRPQRTELQRRVELSATVEALKRVELCARVPGAVDYLPDDVDIGRRVKAGEKLVHLAVPDLEADKKYKEALLDQARKQKTQAEEARAVAEREVEESQRQEQRYAADLAFQKLRHQRIRELVSKGAQDKQLEEEATRQLEAAEAGWQAAQAQSATRRAKARAAEADLEVAGRRIQVAEADVGRLAEQIDFATVRAPFDGIITKRWVDPGAMIKDPAAPLLTVMQLDRVRVLIDVPQRDVPLVAAGLPDQYPDDPGGNQVKVRFPALVEAVPGGELTGTITRMGKALDPVTRTMRAEIELENPLDKRKEPILRPGMFGTAILLLQRRTEAVTIPAAALVRRGQGEMVVYVVAQPAGQPTQGVIERRSIRIGLDDGRRVEVLEGLTGDELVIASGNGVLRAEDRVTAVPAREP